MEGLGQHNPAYPAAGVTEFWTDDATGLPCMAVVNSMQAWCGYVGVPKSHALYGFNYTADQLEYVRVHGGLTFAGTHVDKDDATWWYGFDCGHAGDVVPGIPVLGAATPLPWGGVSEYRDLDYVRGECTDLASQLAQRAT